MSRPRSLNTYFRNGFNVISIKNDSLCLVIIKNRISFIPYNLSNNEFRIRFSQKIIIIL